MTRQKYHIPYASDQLFFIIGPCAIEGRTQTLEAAWAIAEIANRLGTTIVFKSSFDKANRTSLTGFRGVGMAKGLEILSDVRETTGLPVVTDIHTPEQAAPVAAVVDMLQIPAFLCRQTDILISAASTGKPLNIKKGQFLSPWDMRYVCEKVASINQRFFVCERGSCFGYNNLVVDMRSLEIMKDFAPVVFDATHSVQLPGVGGKSDGQRQFVAPLARAAVAIGVAGVFLESHPNPDAAPCDGPNMLPLLSLEDLCRELLEVNALVKRLRREI